MQKSVLHTLYLLISTLICLSLIVGFLILGPASAGLNELLSPTPSLKDQNGNINWGYLNDLSQYFGDHFFLRQECITLYARLNAALFSHSVSDDVILGKNGWLFFSQTIPDFTGSDRLSSETLCAIAGNLKLIQEFCNENETSFLFCCVPNKNTLYPQYMEGFSSAETPHDFEILQNILSVEHTQYVDICNAFREQDEILYFAHDSHWNSKGAALAADLIFTSLGSTSTHFTESFSSREPHDGDLYKMLYPTASDPETDCKYGRNLSYEFDKKSGTRPDSITIRTHTDKEGSLLMYRDSFGNLLFPYLASGFGSAVFSRSAEYDLTSLLAGETDCLVIEIVERNLRQLLDRIPIMPAPQRPSISGICSDAIPLSGNLSASLSGFHLWQGKYPFDIACPVFLLTEDCSYECFRMENGRFAAYLPDEMNVIGVCLTQNGQQTILNIQE